MHQTEVAATIILQKLERVTGEIVTTAAHLTARDAAVGQDTAEHAALKVRSDFRQIRSLKGQYHNDKKVLTKINLCYSLSY